MYWDFNIEEMKTVIKILLKHLGDGKNHLKADLDGKEYSFSRGEGYSMHISFRRAIELDGEFLKPHLLASTEY